MDQQTDPNGDFSGRDADDYDDGYPEDGYSDDGYPADGYSDRPADDYDEEFWEGDPDDRPSARERWLKIALLAVAAGLAATIISLLTQGSDDEADITETEEGAEVSSTTAPADGGAPADGEAPADDDANPATTSSAVTESTTADGQAAPPPPGGSQSVESGSVTIDIDVLTETGGQAAEVATRFSGSDYDTTVTFLGDPENYSGSPIVQELRFVGGAYHYRSSESDEWQPVDDPSSMILNEGITMPADIVGWSTAGVDQIVTEAGITATADGQPATGTITVAQARAMPDLPPAIALLADDRWDWRDDQPIDIAVTSANGLITRLDAQASDEDPDRLAGTLTISASTVYTDLNAGTPIEAP